MKLSSLFEKKTFVITGEVGPVKGAMPRGRSASPACLTEAEQIKSCVQAVNVTDNQSAVMRLGSLAASVRLKERGIEPVFQMTCRDRNRIALQSDLLSAYSLGIDNVLLLTGDHITLGDHKEARPVFDLDSVQLIKMASGLRQGFDLVGNTLTNPPDLCLGAVVNPGADPLELQLLKMKKKIQAGADFFQTQAVYDADAFKRFMDLVQPFDCPVQVGVVVLKSAAMGRFMNKNVSGITVPQAWIDEIEGVAKADRRKKAAEMTGRFLKQVKSHVQGVHIMPLGWVDIVPDILGHADIEIPDGQPNAEAISAQEVA